MATSGLDACDQGDRVVVPLRGELDIVSAPAALAILGAAAIRGQIVVADLAELDFLDCSAVRTLMQARAVARESGGDVVLANSHGCVLRILALLGVADVGAESPLANRNGPADRIAVHGQNRPGRAGRLFRRRGVTARR
jgi:anti-anti-sigma factor